MDGAISEVKVPSNQIQDETYVEYVGISLIIYKVKCVLIGLKSFMDQCTSSRLCCSLDFIILFQKCFQFSGLNHDYTNLL